MTRPRPRPDDRLTPADIARLRQMRPLPHDPELLALEAYRQEHHLSWERLAAETRAAHLGLSASTLRRHVQGAQIRQFFGSPVGRRRLEQLLAPR